ncbi:MAG: trimeric intracellular cation channel family protein [Desulfobacterales bacterium]|nr:trimeric intracellular cation channel family protein [Desulfobacterales bacterium]MDD4391792.1 trimeric intracellular cation channel family protein [Desulfobacterales bacterium]
MIYILDIFGTFVFAISGAFRAVKYELDILGVLVLAIATGVGGGLIRDVIIGSTPPAAFQDETYLLICILGGLIVFISAPKIAKQWDLVMVADAVGLGAFAAIGAARGAIHGLGPMGIMMMGAITATGGGVIRDMLVSEIPAVIRTDFYATAALAGGGCFFIMKSLEFGEPVQLFSAIVITTGLRVVAMIFKLNLPKVRSLPESPSVIARNRKTRRKK